MISKDLIEELKAALAPFAKVMDVYAKYVDGAIASKPYIRVHSDLPQLSREDFERAHNALEDLTAWDIGYQLDQAIAGALTPEERAKVLTDACKEFRKTYPNLFRDSQD